jgi:predicted acylesterase/phospholipase RssA
MQDVSSSLTHVDLSPLLTWPSFTCAVRKSDNGAVRFRTYHLPEELPNRTELSSCTIWQAARATSAAPFYFPTAKVGGVKYWDGGLANNNPIDEVWGEKSTVFGQQPVACILSLGTGFSSRKPKKSILPVIGRGKRVLDNVTNVDRVHERFGWDVVRPSDLEYFRFNPSTADDKIGLADYKLLRRLEAHTERYLEDNDVKLDIKRCAQLLARPPPPKGEPASRSANVSVGSQEVQQAGSKSAGMQDSQTAAEFGLRRRIWNGIRSHYTHYRYGSETAPQQIPAAG